MMVSPLGPTSSSCFNPPYRLPIPAANIKSVAFLPAIVYIFLLNNFLFHFKVCDAYFLESLALFGVTEIFIERYSHISGVTVDSGTSCPLHKGFCMKGHFFANSIALIGLCNGHLPHFHR